MHIANFPISLIHKLTPDVRKVRSWVSGIRRENPKLSDDQVSEIVCDRVVWTYTRQGAALAVPGIVPGLGTGLQIGLEAGAITTDVALLIRNQTYLVFALGECYGIRGRELLIEDTLISIGLWAKALSLTKAGAVKVGSKILRQGFRKHFSAVVLKAINKKVGVTILTKYGTKRGGVALGKLVPFGAGVLVGGGFSYLTMRRFSASARKYLSLTAAKRGRG